MAVKYMMCSLPLLRSSKKQIAVVIVLGVVPQFTRQVKANCLISWRAGAWHYRIFPDFLNSGLKMASKIERKAKVIACSWNDIKGQITPESQYSKVRAIKNLD